MGRNEETRERERKSVPLKRKVSSHLSINLSKRSVLSLFGTFGVVCVHWPSSTLVQPAARP